MAKVRVLGREEEQAGGEARGSRVSPGFGVSEAWASASHKAAGPVTLRLVSPR